MSMPILLQTLSNHLFALIGGCAVSVLSALMMSLIGAAVTPRDRWFTASGAVYGCAFFVCLGWWSVKLGCPLRIFIPLFITLMTAILAVRILVVDRKKFSLPRITPERASRLLQYVILYATAYAFVAPPADSGTLPIVFYGNNDIFNYANVASFLLRLGKSNIYGFDYFVGPYPQTPGVFYVLDLFAVFFRGEVLESLMPMLIGLSALLGLCMSEIARRLFGLSVLAGTAIGMLFISGIFYQYIVGMYFLSQLTASAVFLLLIMETAKSDDAQRAWTASLRLWTPYYFLVFYLYPPILVMMALFQVGQDSICRFLAVCSTADFRFKTTIFDQLKRFAWWGGLIISAMAFTAAVDPFHFIAAVRAAAALSADTTNGWPLGMISPLATAALPGPQNYATHFGQILSSCLFLVAIATITLLYFCKLRNGDDLRKATYVMIAALSFLAYYIVFAKLGPSYRQWKFASYFPMLLGFLLIPAVFSLVSDLFNPPYFWPSRAQMLVMCALIAGNYYFFQTQLQMRRLDFSSSFENLRRLDEMGDWNDLYVSMSNFPNTFLPAYFIHNKVLHLLSASYYPRASLERDSISKTSPLFKQEDHCDASDGLEIGGLGCLYAHQPSLTPERVYPFAEEHSFIRGDMYAAEPWGRWGGRTSILELDGNSAQLQMGKVGFLNLHLSAFLAPGKSVQEIRFFWGRDKTATLILAAQKWISLPLEGIDWIGSGNQTMQLKIVASDAISPHEIDPASNDPRKISIGFLALSITRDPSGEVLHLDNQVK